jgi:hypothetical protein
MGCGCGGNRSYRNNRQAAVRPKIRAASTSHKTVPTHQLNALGIGPVAGRESQITQEDRDAAKRRRDIIRRKLGR